MPKLTINGTEIEVAPGTSVLQACEQLGLEVPRFCYHDRLSVPANCRMCLVEIEKSPKPVASCAMPASDGMVVKTESDLVKRVRKDVMEMLLINHPLDCPICDQGGECDLQDQAMAYGFDRGRYAEPRRAVKDKDIGPLVKTVMTRCIHCTRCVRFADEIAGTPELGMTGRSDQVEIGTYIRKALTTELSGNLIDICPVGALTNKPYAFQARPWELVKTESIDVLDGIGCNIRIDTRGSEVMRILPRLNEDVNEEWINDKSRFACDGLTHQRLDQPYVRVNGKLKPASWDEAFAAIAKALKDAPGDRIAALVGDMADSESMYALKRLMQALGSPNIDCRQDGATYDTSARAGYIFNSGIAAIEQSDAILLIGTNPRIEGTLVNTRIRKRWLRGGLKIGLIGPRVDLSYPYTYLGPGPQTLETLLRGQGAFVSALKSAKAPMLILGAGALARGDGVALQAVARKTAESFGMVREGWTGFNVLQLAASRVGGLDMGFTPQQNGKSTAEILAGTESGAIQAVYLLGADEIDMRRLGKAFVVYQGHHGDAGANRADVILPGAAYTEKDGTYVNTEGRVQLARRAAFPPGQAREDWKILRALSEHLGRKLPFDTLADLRRALVKEYPSFGKVDAQTAAPWQTFGREGALRAEPFVQAIENFYMTDPISRASPTMAECTETLLDGGMQKKAVG